MGLDPIIDGYYQELYYNHQAKKAEAGQTCRSERPILALQASSLEAQAELQGLSHGDKMS